MGEGACREAGHVTAGRQTRVVAYRTSSSRWMISRGGGDELPRRAVSMRWVQIGTEKYQEYTVGKAVRTSGPCCSFWSAVRRRLPHPVLRRARGRRQHSPSLSRLPSSRTMTRTRRWQRSPATLPSSRNWAFRSGAGVSAGTTTSRSAGTTTSTGSERSLGWPTAWGSRCVPTSDTRRPGPAGAARTTMRGTMRRRIWTIGFDSWAR